MAKQNDDNDIHNDIMNLATFSVLSILSVQWYETSKY